MKIEMKVKDIKNSMNNAFNKMEAENEVVKYSDLMSEFVDTFDNQMPEEWTSDDTIELGVEAWNLANKQNNLAIKGYRSIIKNHKQSKLLHKMVKYKHEHFADFPNTILEYEITKDKLKIKSQNQNQSQNQKDTFESLLMKMMTTKSIK